MRNDGDLLKTCVPRAGFDYGRLERLVREDNTVSQQLVCPPIIKRNLRHSHIRYPAARGCMTMWPGALGRP